MAMFLSYNQPKKHMALCNYEWIRGRPWYCIYVYMQMTLWQSRLRKRERGAVSPRVKVPAVKITWCVDRVSCPAVWPC